MINTAKKVSVESVIRYLEWMYDSRGIDHREPFLDLFELRGILRNFNEDWMKKGDKDETGR